MREPRPPFPPIMQVPQDPVLQYLATASLLPLPIAGIRPHPHTRNFNPIEAAQLADRFLSGLYTGKEPCRVVIRLKLNPAANKDQTKLAFERLQGKHPDAFTANVEPYHQMEENLGWFFNAFEVSVLKCETAMPLEIKTHSTRVPIRSRSSFLTANIGVGHCDHWGRRTRHGFSQGGPAKFMSTVSMVSHSRVTQDFLSLGLTQHGHTLFQTLLTISMLFSSSRSDENLALSMYHVNYVRPQDLKSLGPLRVLGVSSEIRFARSQPSSTQSGEEQAAACHRALVMLKGQSEAEGMFHRVATDP